MAQEIPTNSFVVLYKSKSTEDPFIGFFLDEVRQDGSNFFTCNGIYRVVSFFDVNIHEQQENCGNEQSPYVLFNASEFFFSTKGKPVFADNGESIGLVSALLVGPEESFEGLLLTKDDGEVTVLRPDQFFAQSVEGGFSVSVAGQSVTPIVLEGKLQSNEYDALLAEAAKKIGAGDLADFSTLISNGDADRLYLKVVNRF